MVIVSVSLSKNLNPKKLNQMKTANINIYQFSELSAEARQKAVSEHEAFLLSEGFECENASGEMVTEYIETIKESEVIESIEMNDYLYFMDGTLAHSVTYCGNHPQAGKTELKFYGQTIEL